MTDFKSFKGAAKRIEDVDLPRIAHTIGVTEDHIHAVIDVEARGSGFDEEGRPKALFEPHVFFRNLTGEKLQRAVAAGLAYRAWRSGSYPKDSYPRIKAAMLIDETAALKATSWGLGQILGENFQAAGYDTPQAMVEAFMEDEDNHLEAMIAFIKANHLDDDLRREDWMGFARGYNGAGFAANRYDQKLAAAFKWWQGKPDTPWSPDMLPPPPEVLPQPDRPETPPVTLLVTGSGLRLRGSAGTDAPVLASLPFGTPALVVQTWHQVDVIVDGVQKRGWISGDFVKPAVSREP